MIEATRDRLFVTTHWSAVWAAGQSPDGASRAREALCRTYWQPLYLYIRHQGYSPEDAQDLTQGFLLHLLERNPFAELDPRHGRFRSFLLISLKHYLADARHRAQALKRGGGYQLLSLDYKAAENRFSELASSDMAAGQVYDRQWALTVFDEALRQVGCDYASASRRKLYGTIKCFLSTEGDGDAYALIGGQLGMSTAAVRMAVLRLRQRFRKALWEIVAATVSNESEVAEEIQYLIHLLSR